MPSRHLRREAFSDWLSRTGSCIGARIPRQAKTQRRTREYLEFNRAFKMAPILSDYINEGEILAMKGSLERPISGLVMDSRRVVPGNLFFALPGLRSDGPSFVDEAVSRGASAIIGAEDARAPAREGHVCPSCRCTGHARPGFAALL